MAVGQYLKIVNNKDQVHILPDNTHNRTFHQRYTTGAQPGDKYKTLSIVKGEYKVDKETGSQSFEEKGEIERLYENLTPTDSKAAAYEAENDALKAQIEELTKQLKKNGKKAVENDDDK